MQEDLAVPFLERPPKLDGTYAGDIGFDPVGFSNYFDLRWLREAELKHGRVCMLGVVGFLAQEFVTFPMFANGKTPVDDFFVVPATGLWQIFFAIGLVEAFSNGFKLTPSECPASFLSALCCAVASVFCKHLCNLKIVDLLELLSVMMIEDLMFATVISSDLCNLFSFLRLLCI